MNGQEHWTTKKTNDGAVRLFLWQKAPAGAKPRGTILFGSFLAYTLVDFVSAVQRHATKLFVPTARHDAIAVVAGVVAALLVMALHPYLFGVAVAPWAKGS